MKLVLLATVCLILVGCESYQHTGVWTPDSFNYTMSRDRQTGDLTDYWGLNWQLK